MYIVPSILALSEQDYQKKINQIKMSDLTPDGRLHIDLMDYMFVPNRSIAPSVIGEYPISLKKEVHLMVKYPENWIDDLIGQVDRIIIHTEEASGIAERIAHIRNHGKEVGLAINPETSLEKLDPFMSTIDCVLVMSVHPGFSGQSFLRESLLRVEQLKALQSLGHFEIGVDGGVNARNVHELQDAGADYVTVASALFEGDFNENYQKIYKLI
jgi:ribulose-phosphate 3-epimerase